MATAIIERRPAIRIVEIGGTIYCNCTYETFGNGIKTGKTAHKDEGPLVKIDSASPDKQKIPGDFKRLLAIVDKRTKGKRLRPNS